MPAASLVTSATPTTSRSKWFSPRRAAGEIESDQAAFQRCQEIFHSISQANIMKKHKTHDCSPVKAQQQPENLVRQSFVVAHRRVVGRLTKHLLLLLLFWFFATCTVYGANPSQVRRFGQVAKLKADKVETYKQLHANIWPKVVAATKKFHMTNYSIWMKELEPGEHYLFGYFEYTGNDFDQDMKDYMQENSEVKKWEIVAGNCLEKLSDDDSESWKDMEEVFHFPGKEQGRNSTSDVRREAMVVGLRPEMVDSYKLLHRHAWPEILEPIAAAHITNYSIFLKQIDKKYYLFSYWEYLGNNYKADMSSMESDPPTQAWMKLTDNTCQLPIPTRQKDEWWANMEKVFQLK
jgi:L-rhamnose mutarotase